MESFSGETEESAEEIPGRKKSKLKSLKTRLFGKSKRGGGEGDAKLSQSASDITAGKEVGSHEDLACSEGTMGSRALSHDSIFLADQVLTDAEPARVLSQENVHSKIKALQIKLQQQKMHLGPPPLVLPVRRPEDPGNHLEDDSLPHSPPEIAGALSKALSQPSSRPLSPVPKPASTKPLPQTPSLPLPSSVPSNPSPTVEPPLDFSSPAQFTPSLDTSAARHRMAVKPRNQRASTKKTLTANDSDVHALNNIDHPVREEEWRLPTREEETPDTERRATVVPITSQLLPSRSPEVEPITLETASKPSGPAVSQQDHALLGRAPSAPSQVLRIKPPRPAGVMPSERPHSSFIHSELKDNRDRDVDTQVMSRDKRKTLPKPRVTEVSTSVHQQVQGEPEKGLKRPTQGSGSFHFSITHAKNRDGERPRSGSFAGMLEHAETRHKTVSGVEDKLRGGPFAVGRLEGALQKSSVPWDRRDSLKKVEPVTPSKNATTAAGAEKLESSQEVVEDAVEAQEVEEGEGKTGFGVKLRSASLSIRFQPDSSSNHEEQCDKIKTQEIGDLRPTDPSPSGFSDQPRTAATEVQTSSSVETAVAAPREPQPAQQTASSEVSWMSLAMEKTRSLQQLFTSRFPRDFTGVQSAARPQAQEQTQTVKTQQSATPVEAAKQPSTDAIKAETVQSQAQTVKPSPKAVQQKASPLQANTSREAETFKPTSETQSGSHPAAPTTPWTQSPLHSAAQTETTSQFAQGGVTQSLAQFYLSSGQQQPPRSSRGHSPAGQLKSTTPVSAPSSASPAPPVSAEGRGEREAGVQETEGACLPGRRAVRAGSVSGKAAFLEKRAEWTTPPGTKGVELKKAQTEVQVPGESPVSVKPPSISKDIKPEGGQGVKLAESSPTKVPERPREEKWLRKNAASSPLPSSSPTMPSALQSISESGQPSWMELAKRKSMAWSDKSME